MTIYVVSMKVEADTEEAAAKGFLEIIVHYSG